MDLADIFKKGLQNLRKDLMDKNYKKRSLLSRKESFINARRQTRNTLMFNNRNININMSPFLTPESTKKKQPEAPKPQVQVTNKRWEMLQQWKERKNKQKQEEKKHAKPIFKVCHVDKQIGLPNLEKVNKEIKGKPIKPLPNAVAVSFAPVNHKFNPPKNIKPVQIVKPVARNVQSKFKNIQPVKLQKVTETKNIQKSKFNNNSVRLPQKKPQESKDVSKLGPKAKVTPLSNGRANISKAESSQSNKTVGFNLHQNSISEDNSLKKGNSGKKYQKTPLKPRKKNTSQKESNIKEHIDTTPVNSEQFVFKTPVKNYVTPKNKFANVTPLSSSKNKRGKSTKQNEKTIPETRESTENSVVIVIDDDSDVTLEKVVIYDDEEITLKTPVKVSRKSRMSSAIKDVNKSIQIDDESSKIEDNKSSPSVQNQNNSLQVPVGENEVTTNLKDKTPKSRRNRNVKKSPKKIVDENKVQSNIDDESLNILISDKNTFIPRSSRKSVRDVNSVDSDEVVAKSPKKSPKTPKSIRKLTKNQNQIGSPEKTPTNTVNKSLVYISPFVTISRGKDSARKEFTARKSTGGTFSTKTPDGKDFSENTSPQAGADYFERILNNQITRIESICAVWQKHKDSNVSEEAGDMIDVAIGQSKLLISKKFEQFRGLIKQCRLSNFEEKPITCEDLHGFWDMMYHQIIDLDKRFDNLERLRNNNWEEIQPEKKIVQNRGRGRPKKKTTSSSSIREAIKAARNKMKNDDHEIDNLLLVPKTPEPVKNLTPITSSSKRRSLRVSLLRGSSIKRLSSPGLTMMKITQAIKAGDGLTPSKSILKTDNAKSAKRHTKSVLFVDDVPDKVSMKLQFTADDKENTPKVANVNSNKKVYNLDNLTPLRKSKRLSTIT